MTFDPKTGRPRSLRNVVIGSLLGSVVEYYDFAIFVAASSLIFQSQFFPSFDHDTGVLVGFMTYGSAYLARPLGALIFGHLGDRIGRKPVLLATFFIMGAATILIGCLPSYGAIGIWASVFLVVLRLIQGLANGGEFGGAALMATESAPPGRKGFYASSALVGLAVGNLLGTGIFSLFALMPHDAFVAWGWRMPFLLSLCLVLPGLWVRRGLDETPVFREATAKRPSKAPVLELLREEPRHLVLVIGLRVGETILFNVATVYALFYATKSLHLPPSLYLGGLTVASFVSLAVTPAFGAWSDQIGRRRVALIGGVVTVLVGLVFLPLLGSGSIVLAGLAVVLAMGFAAAINNATPGAWLPELFSVTHRYTAISLGYQLGAIAGGVTPVIAVLLQSAFGPWSVALLMIVAGMIIVTCAALLPETVSGKREQDMTANIY